MSKKVSNYLLYLGFNPILKGYRYLNEIIDMNLRGERILPLKYYGYKIIAQKYNKDISCIDKNIQNSISHVWLKADEKILEEEFSNINIFKGKPTNKNFIETISKKLL